MVPRLLITHKTLLIDTLVAAAVVGYTFILSAGTTPFNDPQFAYPWRWLPGIYPVFIGWCISACALLSLARTKPAWVCWGSPLLLLIHLIFFPVSTVSVAVTFYTMVLLGRFALPRWRRPAAIAALVGTTTAVLFRADLLKEWPVVGIVAATSWLVLGFFWQWGARMRDRDLEMKALRDRASLAAISERTRIAREMHDIVAHSLTAIIVQADGGRYVGKKDPEKAVEALTTIASTARQSLEQMRGLLSVLRTDDPSSEQREATPRVDAVPQLVREARANGLVVNYHIQGNPRHLDATPELSIYRIVQELLTNALRHAGTGEVELEIVWGDREVMVRAQNEVSDHHKWDPRNSPGRGLTGIRERAELHGGRIEIDEDAGFSVIARIPGK